MFCPKCGKELPEESTYCSFCGSNTEKREISLDKKKQWGAICIGVVGIFFWILMALAVPLNEYEANIFWKSEKYLIFWLVGYLALAFSNEILKKYQKSHMLEGTEKKCYKILRMCFWLAWLIPAYVIFVLGK